MSDKVDEVTITHQSSGPGGEQGGKYIAVVAGESATGHLEWELQDEGVRVATHTIVPKEIGGRGVAAHLVKALIADAREHGFKVVPQCWYVAKKFDENPDWADLRA